jgi:hypothetical protein
MQMHFLMSPWCNCIHKIWSPFLFRANNRIQNVGGIIWFQLRISAMAGEAIWLGGVWAISPQSVSIIKDTFIQKYTLISK